MTRITHSKTAARALAAAEGLTYQQALNRLRAGAPLVPACRVVPGGEITRLTNGTGENIASYNGVTLDAFLTEVGGVSYWDAAAGALVDSPTGADWFPLTSAEAAYVPEDLIGMLLTAYAGHMTPEGGSAPVKVLLPCAEVAYDDPDWRQIGTDDLPAHEVALEYAQALSGALTGLVEPLGGYVTVEVDDYISGPCHTVEVVVPLPSVMAAYPDPDAWFEALRAVDEAVPYPA